MEMPALCRVLIARLCSPYFQIDPSDILVAPPRRGVARVAPEISTRLREFRAIPCPKTPEHEHSRPKSFRIGVDLDGYCSRQRGTPRGVSLWLFMASPAPRTPRRFWTSGYSPNSGKRRRQRGHQSRPEFDQFRAMPKDPPRNAVCSLGHLGRQLFQNGGCLRCDSGAFVACSCPGLCSSPRHRNSAGGTIVRPSRAMLAPGRVMLARRCSPRSQIDISNLVDLRPTPGAHVVGGHGSSMPSCQYAQPLGIVERLLFWNVWRHIWRSASVAPRP